VKGWKAGESQAAKLLEQWWGLKFFRTPGSGSMATSRVDSLPPSIVASMRGDIICDLQDESLSQDVRFPFVVEVKAYAKIDLYALLRRGSFEILPGTKAKGESDLWICWYQAKKEAFTGRRWPLLLFKEDRKPWYVAFYNEQSFAKTITSCGADALFFQDMAIMLWDTFASTFPRSIVEEFARLAIDKEGQVLAHPRHWAEPPDDTIDPTFILGKRR